MGLDDIEFGLAYSTGLVEDLNGYVDLTDIMDQPGQAESIKLPRR